MGMIISLELSNGCMYYVKYLVKVGADGNARVFGQKARSAAPFHMMDASTVNPSHSTSESNERNMNDPPSN